MSLRIIIDNKDVALPVDVEVDLKVYNYFFKDRDDDATYPFTLNLNANRHIFGFPERLGKGQLQVRYPAMMSFGPYTLLQGECVVTDFNPDEIEIFLTAGQSTFWKKCGQRLDDLPLGRESFTSVPAMMKAFTESLRGTKDYVVCPLYDPYVTNTMGGLYNAFYNFLTVSASGNSVFQAQIGSLNCVFAPFVRLVVVIEKIITALGYRIGQNDLALDEKFRDIILVCRNKPTFPSDRLYFDYTHRVPEIKASVFLQEVENKFGCRFSVDEKNKIVSVLSLNFSSEYHSLQIQDPLQVHFLDEDDQTRGFVFCDKENPDKYLKKYYNDGLLSRTSGDPEDAKKTECISAPVGWTKYNVLAGYVNCMAVAADYQKDMDYHETLRNEIRFAVYRGYILCDPDSAETGNRYYPYPVASAEPLPSTSTMPDLSLLYHGAGNFFDRYLSSWINIMKQIDTEVEFLLENKVIFLNDLRKIFSKALLIRNKKYRCYEQEIKLGRTHIVEYIIRCYPA